MPCPRCTAKVSEARIPVLIRLIRASTSSVIIRRRVTALAADALARSLDWNLPGGPDWVLAGSMDQVRSRRFHPSGPPFATAQSARSAAVFA